MLVTFAASGALAIVNSFTAPKIAAQKQKEFSEGLLYVLPECENGVILHEQAGNDIYYLGYANNDTTDLTGYAFSCFDKGYSSTIWTLVGVDTAGLIKKIKVLDQKETPGLGTRCAEIKSGEDTPWWQRQFQGKKATEVSLDKDQGDIVSITGATITSRAITDGIARRSSAILNHVYAQE